MANRDLFYFYAPTWDYPPEGPIKLGNVISSVKKPHIPLIHSPPTEETGVFKTEKKKVQYTTEKLRSGKFSILTKFLSVLGFGVDIGAEVVANRDLFYFYAPTWDYPPEGPIKLGNVISSVKKPHIPLIHSPPTEETGVFKTEKKKVQYTTEKLRSGKFSILTKFLSVLGFGVDIGAEVERINEEIFKFETLETTEFIPTSEYLQNCVESRDVREWLERSGSAKPLYIITGLKSVTGASATTLKSRTVGGNLSVEVDGTILSGGTVPIGGGPGIEGKAGTSQGTKWEGGNFVFAFRVSKVRVKKTGKIKSEDQYTKGANLDLQDVKRKQTGLKITAVEEPSAQDEGFEEETLMEGDEEVLCAIPKDEDSDDG